MSVCVCVLVGYLATNVFISKLYGQLHVPNIAPRCLTLGALALHYCQHAINVNGKGSSTRRIEMTSPEFGVLYIERAPRDCYIAVN